MHEPQEGFFAGYRAGSERMLYLMNEVPDAFLQTIKGYPERLLVHALKQGEMNHELLKTRLV